MRDRIRIGPKERAAPAPNVHSRLVGDDLILLDLAKGEYFALDAIGAALWQAFEAGRTIEQAATDLSAEYDAEAAVMISDLVALANELADRGLLIVRIGADDG